MLREEGLFLTSRGVLAFGVVCLSLRVRHDGGVGAEVWRPSAFTAADVTIIVS